MQKYLRIIHLLFIFNSNDKTIFLLRDTGMTFD